MSEDPALRDYLNRGRKEPTVDEHLAGIERAAKAEKDPIERGKLEDHMRLMTGELGRMSFAERHSYLTRDRSREGSRTRR